MRVQNKNERENPGTAVPIGLETQIREVGVSVVVPVYNEVENLRPFYSSLTNALDGLDLDYEVLLIDDGSTDGSLELLREFVQSDSRFRLLEFIRNFGQTAAIAAGFEHARGELIIPIDADLQNDPADIPLVIEKINEGYDCVSCWRKDRKDHWFLRVLPSRIANRLISSIAGLRLHDYGCTLKGYRKSVIGHFRLYGEMHRFIPIYAHWAGARVAEIPVCHHSRKHGSSKYGSASRTFKVLLDLITVKFLMSFSTKPMYLFGGLGFLCFLATAGLSALVLYEKFIEGIRAHRNPLLLIAILVLLVGVQFLLFGLIAELIVRTYHESQGKPIYILRKKETDLNPMS